jgi:7,8-dihydropterin-6-yl-methyl-4-(beta-D-ribofuranosyl)aminobenzene 5'-phosphate synthase
MTTLTILAENTARGPRILGEHGLAWWIEADGHAVLFDTGQGQVLRHNAGRLGVDLASAEAIVLSHGHYDHVGGLEEALALAPRAAVYLHPAAVEPKYTGSGGGDTARRISTPFVEARRFEAPGRKVVVTREPTEVVPGVWTTGEIPRLNDFEDTGGPFFLDETRCRADPLLDDQALYFLTPEGAVVVLGCAHAGVVNTLVQVARLSGGARIHAVIGGMHLEAASPQRMRRTIARLRELGVQRIAPLHCTGPRAVVALRNALGERCEFCATGSRLAFGGAPRL